MAFTCGFFNSQNGDRKYNAEQMASIFDGLIKDGVYDTVGDIFAVTPGTGMQVLVGSGRAWFDHTWNNNDAQYPLAITAADVSLPRYDAVVLETNHSDTVRTNRLRVLTGIPASNPVKPTMTSTANVKQHPLAYIKVTAGAKAITQSMIQVVVGTSECPFVTGIIDTAQIDALFQQWNGEFDEWFENLKAQLSDNVVANLQGQIDQKVAKADVATTADIKAGTSTTKWVSPKGLKEANITSDGTSVGDVLCTARTDLGDDWALCNGDSVKISEVSSVFSSIYTKIGTDPNSPSFASKNGDISFIIENDGKCVIATRGGGGATNSIWEYAKGTLPYTNWVNSEIVNPSTYGHAMLYLLKNYQNQIIGAGDVKNTSNLQHYMILYTADNFDSAIIGTEISSITRRPTDIAFGNGQFVISLGDYRGNISGSTYAYYEIAIGSIGSTTLTTKQIGNQSNGNNFEHVLYVNGSWWLVTVDYDHSPISTYIYKSNTSDPSKAYTSKSIKTLTGLSHLRVSDIEFFNNIFVISYYRYTDSDRDTIAASGIFTATDLFSTWTLHPNISGLDGRLFNTNGMLFWSSSDSVYMTDDPSGNWTKVNAPGNAKGAIYKDGYYYLLYQDKKSYTSLYRLLPTITTDKTYNYIKVK